MNNKVIILTSVLISSLLTACAGSSDKKNEIMMTTDNLKDNKITYPVTYKGEVIDTYFSTQVADPYRWLEDDRSSETGAWVKTQNTLTFDYLNKIPYRGNYTYFYKNDGLQNQNVVYRQKKGGEAEVFLDPNTFSEDATTSMGQLSFSKDGSIAAYTISEGGSDWRKVIIIDAITKKVLEAPLIDVKFSGLSWYKNEGFYYSSYDKPEGSELSAKTDQHKLYYHKLGQSQKDDNIIFGDIPEEKHRYVGGNVTEDNRYLVISGAVSTSGNNLYLKDLAKPNSPLVTIVDGFLGDTYIIENKDDKLFLVTNIDAPNKKIVTVNANAPKRENWKVFLPETEYVLSASTGGGYFFAEYMIDAISKVYQYDYQGNKIREVQLPGVGSVTALSGDKEEIVLYYSFSNYKTPGTIYSYDVNQGESDIYRKSGAKFDSDAFESKQVFYTSKDGTQVPMIITYKKGLVLNGKNPTLLYAYGGFNISLTPSFSVSRAVWMEQGGIYAVANLRGGGEYGKKWHDAGTQLNKQNVFDDFIAAGEFLIENNYTSSDYLAVQGGSNGGLLVGAVMTQRPDLMQVALPAVGVLDMLRYHTFTAGAGWAYDYGTAEQSEAMFNYLHAYSPVHNVKSGVKYPATMVTTGDHDDRVVPAHSFKFAAELQAKQTGVAPTLIRIETNAGHGAGTPVSKTIDLYADIFAFTLFNMGFDKLPE